MQRLSAADGPGDQAFCGTTAPRPDVESYLVQLSGGPCTGRGHLTVVHAKDFRAVRDMAIVRLFLDTGIRLDELAKLHIDDVDLD